MLFPSVAGFRHFIAHKINMFGPDASTANSVFFHMGASRNCPISPGMCSCSTVCSRVLLLAILTHTIITTDK